jgi:hypothetical protein
VVAFLAPECFLCFQHGERLSITLPHSSLHREHRGNFEYLLGALEILAETILDADGHGGLERVIYNLLAELGQRETARQKFLGHKGCDSWRQMVLGNGVHEDARVGERRRKQ